MANYDRNKMTLGDLETVHELYTENQVFWYKMLACYEGIKSIVNGGYAVVRHERESQENWERRIKEAYGFGYSGSVVDLFNFYLFKSTVKRDMGPLSNNPSWQAFEADCNLYGDGFLTWLLETQRWACVFGHVGVLVDKSTNSFSTQAEELKAGVYPYVARYFPMNILDWEYERDENNRPYLSYIKLRDDDGVYRIWTKEWWAVFKVSDPAKMGTSGTVVNVTTGQVRGGSPNNSKDTTIESIANGDNTLGFVPFVWMFNIKGKQRPIGISDIKDIAYIDLSIIGNLSDGEEVIDYGAFPMMRKPMREKGSGPGGRGDQDDVGPTSILEFDPELPDSKPDWLEAAVQEPITAILNWIERKTLEIYRAANIGNMASTEVQQPKSGVALKSEFQLLNGKLVQKGSNVEEAERTIKKYWCTWQGQPEAADDITVEWPETYDVVDLAQDLQNALTGNSLVQSDTFKKSVQKQIARAMLPNADNALLAMIDKEIDEYKPLDVSIEFGDDEDDDEDIDENDTDDTKDDTTDKNPKE
jgi:hypothetical protein